MDVKNLKYPVYIISKGRYENPITAKVFLKENIPFKIAVEPQEYINYCKAVGKEHVAQLPFTNLGLGSFPARNWCWENSIQNGFLKHFLFDDNIYGFVKFNQGKRKKCEALLSLIALQDFTERYSNVAMSGFNYRYFVDPALQKPFFINTHVYSAMLINNNIPFRWRLKYNEDVDLCLQVLHNKWCTILLNVFLVNKVSTVAKLKGGNQTELYKNNAFEKKILKARSLEMVWPQYVKTVIRFNRPHHAVSWKKHFKHPLLKKL
jgi:hypothetical protein